MSKYTFRHKEVRIKRGDTDVITILPNGTELILQFREEGNSVDVLLPARSPVINWKGVDMTPAKAMKREGKYQQGHIRLADQLCIELPTGAFEKEKKA